ncbi:MAG TPA: ABC transporter permease [Vicinamibacterales bacterium]|nr:ABC transporter permease [Vicinamibacterales bacterium]
MDWNSEVRAALGRHQAEPDEQVVLELAQHAAAAFEAERADGRSPEEAVERIRAQVEIWCRNLADYPRRRTRAAAVPPPPMSSSWLTGWAHDVRYGLRLLRRHRAFTVAAIVTTALGIGAVGTLFSVAYGVLLRPLPWHDSDRLIRVWESRDGGTRLMPRIVTNRTYHAWTERPDTITGLAAWSAVRSVTLGADAEGTRVPAMPVTSSLFGLLAVRPIVGSVFSETAGAELPREIILSHALALERFGGARDAAGRSVMVDGISRVVVGVMPASFRFPNPEVRAWLPYRVPAVQARDGTTTGLSMFSAMARLRPGASAEQAAAEATSRAGSAPRPGMVDIAIFGTKGDAVIHAMPYADFLTQEVREPVIAFLAAVGLLFLTAVASISSMQLARSAARRREIALRAALGAGTGRLARQLLVESALLGLAGGVAGVALTAALHASLPWLLPADFPRLADVSLDWRVMLFSGVVSLLAGLAFGLLPAWQVRRLSLVEVLTEDSLAPVGLAGRSKVGRMRALIMAGQVAVASFLLVGAALLGRTFVALWNTDRGYEPANVMTVRLLLPNRLFKPDVRSGFVRDLLDRVTAIPGVRSAGFTTILPLGTAESAMSFKLPARGQRGPIDAQAALRNVSPGYFEALGIRTAAGRTFTADDTVSSPPVVVVNRAFARAYFDGGGIGEPLPISFEDSGPSQWTIAGVIEDVQPRARGEAAQPEIYMSYRQLSEGVRFEEPILVLRSDHDPEALVSRLRQTVGALHSGVLLDSIMSMEARLMTSLARPRLYAVLLGGFAGLALLIAGVGLYGVLAYGVAQRRREIGVRAALGATPAALVGLVLRQGAAITIAGLAVGLAGAYIAVGWLGGFLFGVTPRDPMSFVIVPIVLLAVATLAAFVPARRAATIDPLRAMRG